MKRVLLTVMGLLMFLVQTVVAQDISIKKPSSTTTSTASSQKPTQAATATVENAAMMDIPEIFRPTRTPVAEETRTSQRQRFYDAVVKLDNAREILPSGEDVPKPELDRPINDAHDDLKMAYACQAVLNSPYYFQQLNFGEEFTLDVTFINTGTEAWDLNVDVMQYTGDLLERDKKYYYDLDKDVPAPADGGTQGQIVYPGQSIRWTLPMRAPDEPYHEDNKYYSAYTLVKNWDLYGDSELHSGTWERDYKDSRGGMFCPVYFYIYVP